MTTKEKAKDLVDKYLDIDSKYDYLSYSMAKQCALIAVDEIQEMLILTRKRLDISDTKQLKINDNNIVYSILWFDEVKQEINKL